MTKILKSITATRNWAGKTILWAIGIVAVMSQFYPYILVGFMLTDKEIPDAGITFVTITVFGLAFILGGAYLNVIVDKFLGPKGLSRTQLPGEDTSGEEEEEPVN